MNTCAAMTALIIEAGFNAPRMYSGRNMYGRECLGISSDDSGMVVGYKLGEALSRVSEEVRDTLSDIKDHIAVARTEALGHSAIHYFPSIAWEPEELDDDDEGFVVVLNYGLGTQVLWPSVMSPELYTEDEASKIVQDMVAKQTALNGQPGRGHPHVNYHHITMVCAHMTKGTAADAAARELLLEYETLIP